MARLADKRRRLGLLEGTWQPFVNATPVREHVRWLCSQGMSTRAIADVSGISLSTVNRLRWDSTQSQARVRARVADAILTIRRPADVTPPGRQVSAVGTARRIRAMQAVGWPLSEIGARLGMHTTYVSRICCKNDRVSVEIAARVRVVYDDLSGSPGPSEKSRRLGVLRRWGLPASWDDIDDPGERPKGLGGTPHRAREEAS